MPDHSLAVRHVLDTALARISTAMTVAVESSSIEFLRNYVRREHVVSFQVTSGIPSGETGLHAREIDGRDMPRLQVMLGHLRGRTLSVAAAKFADQLASTLHDRHGPGRVGNYPPDPSSCSGLPLRNLP